MAHLVVGDADCTFNAVVLTIIREDVPLRNHWFEIATHLELRNVEKDDINTELTLRGRGMNWVFHDILQKWRCRQVHKATLDKLIAAFENTGLNSIAVALEAKFSINGTDDQCIVPTLQQQNPNLVEQRQEVVNDVCVSNNQPPPDGSCIGKPARPAYSALWQVDSSKLIQGSVTPPCRKMNFTNDYYQLTIDGPRKALIINIIQFKDESGNRDGAIYDSLNLISVLSQLNYKVDYYDDETQDFTKERIDDIVTHFKQKCISEKVETFIVFIGSHGEHGGLILSNDDKINLFDDIVYKMTEPPPPETNLTEHWSKIPKVFLISACRNRRDSISRVDNTIICYSCLPNQYSYRDLDGTAYIKSLTKIMMRESCKTDFETIITLVENEVWALGKQQPNYEKLGNFHKLYFNMAP